jgi:hypothetical protein
MIKLNNAYAGQEGHFGVVIDGTATFYSCRVGFQGAMKGRTDMAFVHGGKESIKKIQEMIREAEEMAGIKDVADFEDTNLANTTYIDLNFWCTEPMRLSLFTVLLRGALTYPSWEAAVQMENYMIPTCNAIGRFLSGYNSFQGKQDQWFDVFNGADDKTVERLLQKEPTLDFDEAIIGLGHKVIKASKKRGSGNMQLQAVCELLDAMFKQKAAV